MLLLQDLLAGLAPPKCHFDKSILECSGVWKNKGRTLIHNVTSYLFVYVCVFSFELAQDIVRARSWQSAKKLKRAESKKRSAQGDEST